MNNKNIVDLDNNIIIRSNNIIHNSKTLNDTIGNLENLDTIEKYNLVGAINEVNTNNIEKGAYSTNEIKVGTWLNKKPIYRKVINATKVSGRTLLIPINDLNIDTIFFDRTHSYIVTLSDIVYPFPYNYANTSDTYTTCERDGNNIKINSSEGSYSNGQITLVIEYTKTTD